VRRTFLLTLVIMLAIVSLGYCDANNWGETDTYGLLKKVVPSYLQAAGTTFGGATSIATSVTTIPTSYSLVRKAITDASGFTTGTLANGTPGQILTIFITAVSGSGTFTLTPATKTGFTTLYFDAALDSATLLFVDTSVGWIVIGTNSVVVGQA